MLDVPKAPSGQRNSIAPAMQRSHGIGKLAIKQFQGKSRLANLYQQGCARIKIPNSFESNALEAVLINTSGGLTGGDRLEWQFDLAVETSATITTQACERIYKSVDHPSQIDVKININAHSRLNWLPQETILFDQASLRRKIVLNMENGSTALLVEPLVFGRLEMGETIETLLYQDSWRIRYHDQLIHAEELRFQDGMNGQLENAAVLNKNTSLATIILISPQGETLLQKAREIIGRTGGASYMSFGLENQVKTGKLIARVVAKDSYQLRKTLLPLIELLNQQASLPKCWTL